MEFLSWFLLLSQHRQGLNFHYVLLVVFSIATLYPLNSLLVVLLSRIFHFDYGDTITLVYSVTAKNHAITIGIAVTAFSRTIVALPVVAPLIQIPIMLLILKLSPKLNACMTPTSTIRDLTTQLFCLVNTGVYVIHCNYQVKFFDQSLWLLIFH